MNRMNEVEMFGRQMTVKFMCESDKAKQRYLKAAWPHTPLFDDMKRLKEAPQAGKLLG